MMSIFATFAVNLWKTAKLVRMPIHAQVARKNTTLIREFVYHVQKYKDVMNAILKAALNVYKDITWLTNNVHFVLTNFPTVEFAHKAIAQNAHLISTSSNQTNVHPAISITINVWNAPNKHVWNAILNFSSREKIVRIAQFRCQLVSLVRMSIDAPNVSVLSTSSKTNLAITAALSTPIVCFVQVGIIVPDVWLILPMPKRENV